jgi:D-alanine-D-alanine ligase-like ATP-grasp enzyme
MKITVFLAATYILDCCLVRTKPCKYFQLNSPYFNEQKGIFSKMDIDQLIPMKWRLEQRYEDGSWMPQNYPVFLKPEWGENAAGIFRADNPDQLTDYRDQIKNAKLDYLIQYGALESREFEIFALRDHQDNNTYSVMSITEVRNEREQNPVNSINNEDTCYHDITDRFSVSQKQILWSILERIGSFGIVRLSVRSDSIGDLLTEKFHVIELNLFTPMPIHMMDIKYSRRDLAAMIWEYMMKLAKLTRVRDKSRREKAVYTKLMLYNRHGALAKFIRGIV